MYSVLRFKAVDDRLETMGAQINAILPGAYDGPDRIDGRFSISLSTQPNWSDHRREVLDQIRRLESVLETANQLGCELEIDLAVDPEDLTERIALSLPLELELLQQMNALRIALTITIYTADQS